ncbi:MAG: SLBB domain-containing protein [Fidelibacterota bacterium]|nr:MAG: SLBB domain-containing protein [Candidatus Neomarinimicrobiota bacterium]
MRTKSFFTFIVLFLGSQISAQSLQDIDRIKQEYEEAMKAMRSAQPAEEIIETERPSVDVLTARTLAVQGVVSDTALGLPYFGYDFFSASKSVAIWENLPVHADYLLGPGDEIIISLWGETQLQSKHIVTRDGKVYIDKVGQLSVTGKTLREAKAYLASRFEQVYATLRNPNPTTYLDISLGALKSINVKFLGEVNLPGILAIHPFSTVTTGLIQAGGVNKSGSLREIHVIRAGKIHSTVDLYAFLLQGKTDGDIRLRDQDAVFVPIRKSTISIDGVIQRPGIYESLPRESFADVLAYSGGLKPNAQAQLEVVRTAAIDKREHEDNAINVFYVSHKDIKNITTQDGDKIRIHAIHPVQREVSVHGQVKMPGSYAYQDSMRLMDLLDLAGGLNDESYWKSVFSPRADVVRRQEDQEYATVIPIYLDQLRQGDESQNILLQNLDQVVIRQNPHFDPPRNVTILGEVNVPGVYTLTDNNEVLENIIAKAGGFTSIAFEDGIEMYRQRQRVVLRDYLLPVMHGDSIYVPSHPGVVLVTGEVYNPGLIHYKKGRSLREYIESAGGFTRDANKRDVSVIYANGDVKLKGYILTPRVDEGATVIVHRKEEREPFDTTRFLTELASISASLATIFYIITRG